jgi:hypothetical protein
MATTSGASHSPKVGSKRRSPYVAIDVDDVIEVNSKKIKPDVELLDDSQEDYLLIQSPFDDSKNKGSSTSKHTSLSGGYTTYKDNSYSPSHSKRTFSHPESPPSADNDEEAKIVAVCDVMPDAKLEDVLCALSSAGGNVELAVAKLLDNPSNHVTEERYSKVKKEEYFDLT